MTRLLVSVRSAAEAQVALTSGADLIDVKEPINGSLGATSPDVWRQVAAVIGTTRPLSAALGELLAFKPAPGTALQSYRYAKLGLAGCARCSDWRDRWQMALATLPELISPVAVVYADYESAEAPAGQEVLHTGQALGCRTLLVDTFGKEQGDVFDCFPKEKLNNLFSEARSLKMQVVLAGSLRLSSLPHALAVWPDYIAIRGAVCSPTRTGALNAGLVRDWAGRLALHALSAPPSEN